MEAALAGTGSLEASGRQTKGSALSVTPFISFFGWGPLTLGHFPGGGGEPRRGGAPAGTGGGAAGGGHAGHGRD
eukprot:3759025-Pyramimonas_sp.AAC.1